MILSLDCATVTGFSAGPIGARPPLLQWGSRDFGGPGKGNGEVIWIFQLWLQELCAKFKPTLIAFEKPYVPQPGRGNSIPMNANTVQRLQTLAGNVEAVAWALGPIECRVATSGEATKHLTGKASWGAKGDPYVLRRAKKKAAVIAACRYHGWDVGNDDNAADALALWSYAEAILSPRAAEHRRREAADRHREQHGEGPLFPSIDHPETTNGAGAKPRAARKPKPTSELSLWPETAQI